LQTEGKLLSDKLKVDNETDYRIILGVAHEFFLVWHWKWFRSEKAQGESYKKKVEKCVWNVILKWVFYGSFRSSRLP
jgi:hypothetical protein